MTALIRKESVEELCAHRERAIELYRMSAEYLKGATEAHGRATVGKAYIQAPELHSKHGRYPERTPEEFLAAVTRQVDQDMWKSFITGTPIGSLMDKEERKKFEDALNDNPPPATPENVWATVERLMGESDTIFRRGLVNAFSKLCRDYKSNDGFKIGERIVCTYGVVYEKGCDWMRTNSRFEETLQDMDRVMHVLDGKPAPDYQQGICAAFREQVRQWKTSTVCETEYWRLKFHKNGNIHLWPLRKDLLDRANKIIAEWYGETIGAGHEAKKGTTEPELRPDLNLKADFFPTPAALAQELIEIAAVEAHHKVLEPSAGEGALLHEVVKTGAKIWAYEIDPAKREKLVQTFYSQFGAGGCACKDFLTVASVREFDRVVMNPPFSRNQGIAHVLHATKFLKPGGRLVAILPAGVKTQKDKWGEAFRKLVTLLKGTIVDLPELAFKESGTLVRTVIVTLDMPENAA